MNRFGGVESCACCCPKKRIGVLTPYFGPDMRLSPPPVVCQRISVFSLEMLRPLQWTQHIPKSELVSFTARNSGIDRRIEALEKPRCTPALRLTMRTPQYRIVRSTICDTIGASKDGSPAMTKAEKLLQRIRNNPKQVTFADLETVLRRTGFEKRQSGGGSSHFNYVHDALPEEIITVPYKRPHVPVVYVEKTLAAIDKVLSRTSKQ